jgi:PilZ domain
MLTGRFDLPLTVKYRQTLLQRQETPVSDEEQHFQSREFQRDPVSIPAEIREKGAGRQKVSVIDLSRSGFRMHCIFLIPDDRTVFLTMEGLESLEARIAWHDNDYYGCEFKQRLHEAVYDHVIRTYPVLRNRF